MVGYPLRRGRPYLAQLSHRWRCCSPSRQGTYRSTPAAHRSGCEGMRGKQTEGRVVRSMYVYEAWSRGVGAFPSSHCALFAEQPTKRTKASVDGMFNAGRSSREVYHRCTYGMPSIRIRIHALENHIRHTDSHHQRTTHKTLSASLNPPPITPQHNTTRAPIAPPHSNIPTLEHSNTPQYNEHPRSLRPTTPGLTPPPSPPSNKLKQPKPPPSPQTHIFRASSSAISVSPLSSWT